MKTVILKMISAKLFKKRIYSLDGLEEMVNLVWDHHTLTTVGMTLVRTLMFFEGTMGFYKLFTALYYFFKITTFLIAELSSDTFFLR